jgi:hypothetical protein
MKVFLFLEAFTSSTLINEQEKSPGLRVENSLVGWALPTILKSDWWTVPTLRELPYGGMSHSMIGECS